MEEDREALRVGPDPEVPAKAKRRGFTAEYKLRILREADRCKETGGVGSLLRREGLYSSHLATWRHERDRGALRDLASRKRGRKSRPGSELERQVAKLQRENELLHKRLEQAETIIGVQKKLYEIFGLPLTEKNEVSC